MVFAFSSQKATGMERTQTEYWILLIHSYSLCGHSLFAKLYSCYLDTTWKKSSLVGIFPLTQGLVRLFPAIFSGLAGNAQSDESTCLWIITSISFMSHSVLSKQFWNIWLNLSNLLIANNILIRDKFFCSGGVKCMIAVRGKLLHCINGRLRANSFH